YLFGTCRTQKSRRACAIRDPLGFPTFNRHTKYLGIGRSTEAPQLGDERVFNYRTSMSEGDTNRLGYLRELAFIAASLVAALLIVRIVFANEVSQGLSANEGLAEFDFVTPGVVSVVIVSIVFYMLRRRGEQIARLLISGIMAAGTLSGLLLFKIWFDASIMIPVLFYVCAAPLGYLGLYASSLSCFV